jgi:long-chain acyl-CoA synthetase
MAKSVADLLVENFQAHRQECAYRQRHGYRMESFTYGEVLDLAFGFRSELAARGIAQGDRVMLWGENCAQWVAAFLGCALQGAVAVPMDDDASPEFADKVLQQSGARVLVASRRHRGSFPAQEQPGSMIILEELPQRHEAREASPADGAIGEAGILEIVFTSGTTADPKGVVITHGNVLANITPVEREIRAYLKYERYVHPVRFLNLMPLSHVFGQFLGMFLPPLLGGLVIFENQINPSEVMSSIRRERVSVLVTVPRVLQSLKDKIERDLENGALIADFRKRFRRSEGNHFLRRWWIFRAIRRRFGWKFWAFISGGASLDAPTEEFWNRLGYAVIQGYGLTETTSLISVNHPFRLGKGSIGKVLAGREVKLADDGEILVRGGGVAAGYWEARAADPVADDQGWYHTGDIGAFDDAGNLYFKGRKKDVIVTPAGMNIYPADLERALRQQAEVKDCVVVGIERGGNAEPCAVVILRGQATLDSVIERANLLLAEYQRMRMWAEWSADDFPRTSTQKPKRNLIAQAVAAKFHGGGNPGLAAEAGPLGKLISQVAGRNLSGIRADASLDGDLGLSSLDRVALLSALEDRYQIDLSEERFRSVRTVGDLERMLSGETPPAAPYHYPRWVLGWPVTWLRLVAHYLLLRPAIILLGWPRILGRERLRGATGPMLVVSNHIGDVDPGFILTALPARLRHRLAIATGGEALEALRTPGPHRRWFLAIYDRIKWVLGVSLLNLFPLPREAGFRRSFAYAGEAVDRGYSVLVFPEGHHTRDGKMLPFRAGIGLLADNLSLPVVPIRIEGLFAVKKAGKKFAAPWKIEVRIGSPMEFPPGTDPARIAAELQRAVDQL